MNNNSSLIQRIRNLVTSFVVVAVIASGTIMVGPEALDVEEITVAAFNIQVFGKAKRSKPDVMEVLVDVAQEFDVFVVQEVRDSSEKTADIFLEELNADSELTYAMYEGPRLGRSSSKEQYVLYYVPALVELRSAYTFPDDDDVFEREPLVATLSSGNFDFTIIVCHVKPDDAESELHALEDVVSVVLEADPTEEDIILMGDFNADGDYLDEDELPLIFSPDEYHILITNDLDTMTTSDNTYDRMIVMDGTFDNEYVLDSAAVYRFDSEFGLADGEFVQAVSDHYPVFASFSVTNVDDDGP
jgi:deoxyribonuclease-1-like protein